MDKPTKVKQNNIANRYTETNEQMDKWTNRANRQMDKHMDG